MQIALISPRGPLYRHKTGIWKKSMRYAPLTLTTLASLIPEEIRADVALYDEGIEDIPLEMDADLIGISAITGTTPRCYELADHFRRQGKTVVLGGVHPTLMPEEAAEHADAVVVGYAEQSWPQLIRDYAAKKLKPRYIQTSVDLSNLPLPKRELLKKQYYTTINTIEATRGCTHGCEFCIVRSAWGSRQFQKPIADVIRELDTLSGKRVAFLDLNLIADEEYAKKLWRAMIPLKIQWVGLTTVKIGWDDELLTLAQQSGCRGLLIGLESVSRITLLGMMKGFNLTKDYRYVIKRLHESGIAIMGCFVFGLDGDTKDVFKRTVDFCIEASVDLPRFAICTPFPNTPLFHRFKKEGRILTEDWRWYDGQHVVYRPLDMTIDELRDGTEWAWKQVYSYSSIFKRLTWSGTQPLLTIPLNLGYRYYAYHLSQFYTCNTLVAPSWRPALFTK